MFVESFACVYLKYVCHFLSRVCGSYVQWWQSAGSLKFVCLVAKNIKPLLERFSFTAIFWYTSIFSMQVYTFPSFTPCKNPSRYIIHFYVYSFILWFSFFVCLVLYNISGLQSSTFLSCHVTPSKLTLLTTWAFYHYCATNSYISTEVARASFYVHIYTVFTPYLHCSWTIILLLGTPFLISSRVTGQHRHPPSVCLNSQHISSLGIPPAVCLNSQQHPSSSGIPPCCMPRWPPTLALVWASPLCMP